MLTLVLDIVSTDLSSAIDDGPQLLKFLLRRRVPLLGMLGTSDKRSDFGEVIKRFDIINLCFFLL